MTVGQVLEAADLRETTDIDGRTVVIALRRHAAADPAGAPGDPGGKA